MACPEEPLNLVVSDFLSGWTPSVSRGTWLRVASDESDSVPRGTFPGTRLWARFPVTASFLFPIVRAYRLRGPFLDAVEDRFSRERLVPG